MVPVSVDIKLMSLKITHVVLITLSVLLSGFFSYTMYTNAEYQNTNMLAGFGAVTTLSLLYYLSIILKKFKTIKT